MNSILINYKKSPHILKSGIYRFFTIFKNFESIINNPKYYEKEFVKDWEEYSGIWDFIADLCLDSEEEEDKIFNEYKTKAIAHYYILIHYFKDLPEYLTLYRMIKVPFTNFYSALLKNKFIEKYQGIGIYWTDTREMAMSYEGKYFGKNTEDIVLTGIIKKGSINLWESLLTKSTEGGDYEKVLILTRGEKIQITKIERIKEGRGLEIIEEIDLSKKNLFIST